MAPVYPFRCCAFSVCYSATYLSNKHLSNVDFFLSKSYGLEVMCLLKVMYAFTYGGI